MKRDHPQKPPSAVEKFLTKGSEHKGPHKTYPWYMVLWLTGVDYFSTLGYQPGIAFLAAGALSPIATTLLIIVTLFGALPMYAQVAKRSYEGQGSVAMLERLLPGWKGKLFVLVLLGFAATGFVITMTLSAADAAVHAVENAFLHEYLGDHKILVTLGLLAMLAIVFLIGFSEAIGVALMIGAPYILLNAVLITFGLVTVFQSDDVLSRWLASPAIQADWTSLIIASAIIFPKLALGLSGFETGVSVMPLIAGDPEEKGEPVTKIKNSQKMLAAAALMMSILLIGSSLVTTTLIPAEEFKPGGEANGRALAYLAEILLGHGFATVYDFVTIAILWFAGASAMTGLLTLIPQYLPRYGMAPRWVSHTRPLVLILFAITVVVTLLFQADVDSQAGAYATGVLALMLSGAVAVSLSLYNESIPTKPDENGKPIPSGEPQTAEQKKKRLMSLYFWGVTLVFLYALVQNLIDRIDGAVISGAFIIVVLVLSGVSRWWRATELRVERHEFLDEESKILFEKIKSKKVNLAPLRTDATYNRSRKEQEIRKYYRVNGEMAFLHIDLKRDRSDFSTPLKIGVRAEKSYHDGAYRGEGDAPEVTVTYVVNIQGAVAIANTIAYVSEQLDPISLFLGLTRGNHMSQAFKYLVWGEGETGIMVYQILIRHWETTIEDDVRPLIFLISE